MLFRSGRRHAPRFGPLRSGWVRCELIVDGWVLPPCRAEVERGQDLPPLPELIQIPSKAMQLADRLVVPFDAVGLESLADVGGKNASLGELIRNLAPLGVKVPAGFATTATAYRLLLQQDDLGRELSSILKDLDADDLTSLQQAGDACRRRVLATPLPAELERAILNA